MHNYVPHHWMQALTSFRKNQQKQKHCIHRMWAMQPDNVELFTQATSTGYQIIQQQASGLYPWFYGYQVYHSNDLLPGPLICMLSACKSNRLTGSKSPQESYADRLKRAGLDTSAMGVRWFAAAEKSLTAPLTIQLPFREQGFFTPDNPLAFGYRINLMQGQQLSVRVQSRDLDPYARIFIELWGPARKRHWS